MSNFKTMSNFLCKSLLFGRYYDNCTRNPIAHYPLSLRWLSSSSSSSDKVSPNELSFTVSYSINSLGFSLEASKAISNQAGFQTSHKPDKAIEFLRNFGFSQTQVLRLVRAFPQILIMNVEGTILPKLEFLESKGISRPEIAKSLCVNPKLLSCSLNKRIIPAFEYLRTLLPSEAETALAVKRNPTILTVELEKCHSANVSTLRRHGVPDSHIAKCFNFRSKTLLRCPVRFREAVEEVSRMGFDPLRANFLLAVRAKASKANWESKVSMYKKWGWSEKDISKAFLCDPWCMHISEERFASLMDFFVLEMGLRPRDLAKCPKIFQFNLKKRVIPRVTVLGALVSKGLMKKVKLYSLLTPTEKVFLQRYVTPYANIAPELSKLYNEGNEIRTLEWTRDFGEISELI